MARVRNTISNMSEMDKVNAVFLADTKGRPRLRAGADNTAVSVPEDVKKEAEETNGAVSRIRINKDTGVYTAAIYYPIKRKESCRRCHSDTGKFLGFMGMYLDAGWMANAIKQARTKLVLGGLALLALLAGIILWLTNSLITRPLLRMRNLAAKIASGDYTARENIETLDEIGDLSESLNIMADAIQTNEIELKRSHDRLIQSEKMSAVGQLAAGVAHEINNPLGIILGFAQSLVKRIKEDDPMALPLKSIEREAARCTALVQDLLVFSRTSKVEEEQLDLNEVLTGALSLIFARAKPRGVEIVQKMSADRPRIFGNKNKLQQTLINLANNAIDAMPEGGTLTIGTSLSDRRPGYVEIQVRDTGRGIPKKIQAKVMEPFFTTKETGKGTGLGLSLVYEIVKSHNGSLELESEEGKGTLFTVFLPIRTEKPPAVSRSAAGS